MKRFFFAVAVSIATLAALGANAFAITKAELLKKMDESAITVTSFDIKKSTRIVRVDEETETKYYSTNTIQATYFLDPVKAKGSITSSSWAKYSPEEIEYAEKAGESDFIKEMETPSTTKTSFYFVPPSFYMKLSSEEGWLKTDQSEEDIAFLDSLAETGITTWYETFDAGKNLRAAGSEKVGSYNCHKLTGVLKSELIRYAFENSTEALAFMLQYKDVQWDDIRDISVTLWVDKKTYFPVKYTMNFKNCLQDLMAQVEPDSGFTFDAITETTTYANINNATDFTIPSEVYKAGDYEAYLAQMYESISSIPAAQTTITTNMDSLDSAMSVDASNPIMVTSDFDYSTGEAVHKFKIYAERGQTLVFADPEIDQRFEIVSNAPISYIIPDSSWIPQNIDPKQTTLTVKPDIRIIDADGTETKLDVPAITIQLKDGKPVAKQPVYNFDDKAFQINEKFEKPVTEEIVTVTGKAPVGQTFTVLGESTKDGETVSGISNATYDFDTGAFTFRAHLRKPGEKHTFIITVGDVSTKLVIERAPESKS